MKRITDAERIERYKSLDLSPAEELELLAYDKMVEKTKESVQLEYDLSIDQIKIARKFAHTGTRTMPTNYKFDKRQRKSNPTKEGIITELANFLQNDSEFAVENLEITNKERMIAFAIGDDNFEVTLIKKNKNKSKKQHGKYGIWEYPIPYPSKIRRGVKAIATEKEYLYVGHYIDVKGRYVLKIGTTNDLDRRAQEHTRSYRKTREYTMPQDQCFVYDWYIKLSKYNTTRYEDRNRTKWQELGIGHFIRNDRFHCEQRPATISIVIRKEYTIPLK